MFTKTEIRTALDVVLDINRDDTTRTCSFELIGTTGAILIFVYPQGKNGKTENIWMYSAYNTDHYISFERTTRHDIDDTRKFNTLNELLEDVKEAAT